MDLKNIFRKLLNKRQPPGQPYISAPLAQPSFSDSMQADDGSYCEAEAEIHRIANMPGIDFGSQTVTQVGENNAKNLSHKHSYIVGTGKLVNEIAQLSGVCPFCQRQAMEQFKAGLINLQAAQLLSLYDTSSAAVCSLCGLTGCIRHIRPVQISESQISPICINCHEALRRQAKKGRIKRFFVFFLLPFITESENGK